MHLRWYREDRAEEEHSRLVEAALGQRRDEQPRREEAATRGTTVSDGLLPATSEGRPPAYQGPRRGFRGGYVYPLETELVWRGNQSQHQQQPSSQQSISAEDRVRENLYRMMNDREAASYPNSIYQQLGFRAYRLPPPRPAQSNTLRAPAFREGWDQPPTCDSGGLPPYSTSEREQREQRERSWGR